MFALDLFNTDYERRLMEGGVDTLEQRRIDDLAMRMDELARRAKEPAYQENPRALAALKQQFTKLKDERDSYYRVREAGIPGSVPTEKIPGKEDLLKGRGRTYYEATGDDWMTRNRRFQDQATQDRLDHEDEMQARAFDRGQQRRERMAGSSAAGVDLGRWLKPYQMLEKNNFEPIETKDRFEYLMQVALKLKGTGAGFDGRTGMSTAARLFKLDPREQKLVANLIRNSPRIKDLETYMRDTVEEAGNAQAKTDDALRAHWGKVKREKQSGVPSSVPTEKIPGKADLLKGKGRTYYEDQKKNLNLSKGVIPTEPLPEHGGGIGPKQRWQDLMPEQMNPEDYDDYEDEDEDLRLRSGDYVRDTQDGEYGEVFRMQGDPEERRVRILDCDGKGWYIEPARLTRVDPADPDVQRYFGKHRQRDMDEMDKSQPSQERHGNRPLGSKGTTATPVTARKVVKDLAMDFDQAFAKQKLVKKKSVAEEQKTGFGEFPPKQEITIVPPKKLKSGETYQDRNKYWQSQGQSPIYKTNEADVAEDQLNEFLPVLAAVGGALARGVIGAGGALARGVIGAGVRSELDDEETNEEQGVDEAKSIKKRVRIVKGSETGKTGTVGEVRHGAFKGAPKTYTVDLDGGGSIQLPKEALRLIPQADVTEGWSERALAQRTGQPQTPYGVYIDGKQWKEFPTDDQARAVARKLEAKFKADGSNKKVSFSPAESYMKKDVKEDQDSSGVESAIIRRIMVSHTDLLRQFGPDKVMQAAEEVAYNVGDVDEIGTSDVSAYVAQVRQILGAE